MAPASFSQSFRESVKPITGTFVDVHYDEVRNKYMNAPDVNEISPQFWQTKLKGYTHMELEFSYIGYEAKDVAVNSCSVIIPVGCSKMKILEIL